MTTSRWLLAPEPRPSHSLWQWVHEVAKAHGFQTKPFLLYHGIRSLNPLELFYDRLDENVSLIRECSQLGERQILEMTSKCLSTITSEDQVVPDLSKVGLIISSLYPHEIQTRYLASLGCRVVYDLREMKISLVKDLWPALLERDVVSMCTIVIFDAPFLADDVWKLVDCTSEFVRRGFGVQFRHLDRPIVSRQDLLACKYYCMLKWTLRSASSKQAALIGQRGRSSLLTPGMARILNVLLQDGWSIAELGQQFKISRSTVYSYIDRSK